MPRSFVYQLIAWGQVSRPRLCGDRGLCRRALVALRRDRVRVARILAIATASLFVVGWGAAQYPYLLAPYLRIEDAAAPPVTLRVLVPILLAGVVVLLPCLWWLFRVFKFARS